MPVSGPQDLLRRMAVAHAPKVEERPLIKNASGEVIPPGVNLRDPEDFTTLRKNIFDGVLEEFSTSFPQTYGGVRAELHDASYEDPEEYDIATQKDALLQNKTLGRRLRGTVKLFDDKTGGQLDEKRLTLMRVPYLTERGSFINNGSEYTSMSQMRLMPGPYTRRKASGELETHFNTQRGTGSSFRVRFEPEKAIYKLDIGQSSMRLYSLLKDIGVSDAELEKSWGPEILKANQKAYDPRVFEKAYARLVKKPDPNATREAKIAAIHAALDGMQVNRRIAQKNLPNLFDLQKSAEWRQAFEKQATDATVNFTAPTNYKPAPVSRPAPKVPVGTPAITRIGHAPAELYEAIRVPETGSQKDPWIRTKHRPSAGSTAYGPVQITGRLAGDYLQRRAKLFSPAELDYLRRFTAQAKLFNQHGGNAGKPGYDPRFDYGGNGQLNGAADRSMYPIVAQRMMEDIYTRQGRDTSKFIRAWRGEPDSAYEKKVLELLQTKKKSSENHVAAHAFVKLARGAVVFLPTGDGKYLLEKNSPDHPHNPNKLRPPGGGQEPGEKFKDTIVREIEEEFGLPASEVAPKIKMLGLEYREQFKGSGVFELEDHGLSPGVYQASNDPDETITLVEADLEDPDYVGPKLDKLSKP